MGNQPQPPTALVPQQAAQSALQVQQPQQQALVSAVNFRYPNVFHPGQRDEGGHRGGCWVLLAGPFGSIKTTWAAMWPNALFISAGQEGGEEPLAYMPQLYGLPIPPVIRLKSTQDLFTIIPQIKATHPQAGICTVVIDSVTYLVKRWLYERLAVRYNSALAGKAMKEGMLDVYTHKRDWGLLASDMQHHMTQLHSTPLNIIWIATITELKKEDEKGNQQVVARIPNIKGDFRDTLSGACKLNIYAERQARTNPKLPGKFYGHPVYHTDPNWMTKEWVRHRFGPSFPEGQLIDPQVGDWPTFNAVASRIPQAIYGLQ